MILKPSTRRVVAAVAFALLCVMLDAFLPSPQLDPASLGWSIALGLLVGYLVWPWFESIEYPLGYFRPTLSRMVKTVTFAGAGALVLAALLTVTIRNSLSAAGLLVAFLFIAALVYVKLGSTSSSRM